MEQHFEKFELQYQHDKWTFDPIRWPSSTVILTKLTYGFVNVSSLIIFITSFLYLQ